VAAVEEAVTAFFHDWEDVKAELRAKYGDPKTRHDVSRWRLSP
jgi:hypothetical protein